MMTNTAYRQATSLLARWGSFRPGVEFTARILTIFFLVMVAFSLARLTWWFFPSRQATLPPPLSVLNHTAASGTSTVVPLHDVHLFGQPQLLTGDAVDAPETHLDLTLRGIISVDEQRVIAIIDQGGSEKPYKVGDTLPNGVKLREIEATRVILERSGRLESLSLPKTTIEQSVASSSGVLGGSSGSTSLGQLRDQLRAKPAEVLALNAVQPVMENGKLKGYRLTDNPYMSSLTAAGLRAGDMVTRINGIPITDQARVPDMLNLLSAGRQISLELERGGVPMLVTLDMSK